MINSRSIDDVAYELAEEIHGGKWNHISEIHTKPVPRCMEIMDEFKRRCPGHTLEQYQKAIADGLFASR